jgi:hypothetical protein
MGHGTWHWIDLGSDGDPYPFALRGLTKARGVYLIRDKRTKSIVYAGSSKNSLYGTLSRHFQSWRRAKKFWHGQYGKAHGISPTVSLTAIADGKSHVHTAAEWRRLGADL